MVEHRERDDSTMMDGVIERSTIPHTFSGTGNQSEKSFSQSGTALFYALTSGKETSNQNDIDKQSPRWRPTLHFSSRSADGFLVVEIDVAGLPPPPSVVRQVKVHRCLA